MERPSEQHLDGTAERQPVAAEELGSAAPTVARGLDSGSILAMQGSACNAAGEWAAAGCAADRRPVARAGAGAHGRGADGARTRRRHALALTPPAVPAAPARAGAGGDDLGRRLGHRPVRRQDRHRQRRCQGARRRRLARAGHHAQVPPERLRRRRADRAHADGADLRRRFTAPAPRRRAARDQAGRREAAEHGRAGGRDRREHPRRPVLDEPEPALRGREPDEHEADRLRQRLLRPARVPLHRQGRGQAAGRPAQGHAADGPRRQGLAPDLRDHRARHQGHRPGPTTARSAGAGARTPPAATRSCRWRRSPRASRRRRS